LLFYHYADELPNELRDRTAECKIGKKPSGLWITDDSRDSWERYCSDNDILLQYLVHRMIVTLTEGANLCWLRSEEEVWAFHDIYVSDVFGSKMIDWEEVAKDFDGVMIFPFHYDLGFELWWYGGWDCASGCIWNPRAVKSCRVVTGVEA
jgi:hypothetical protein